jgi:hypothetical protein
MMGDSRAVEGCEGWGQWGEAGRVRQSHSIFLSRSEISALDETPEFGHFDMISENFKSPREQPNCQRE